MIISICNNDNDDNNKTQTWLCNQFRNLQLLVFVEVVW